MDLIVRIIRTWHVMVAGDYDHPQDAKDAAVAVFDPLAAPSAERVYLMPEGADV